MNANPRAGSSGEPPRPLPPLAPSYEGLSGWLIIVQIGLWLSLVMILHLLFSEIFPIYQSSTWSLLTTPDSEYYHSMWSVLIIFETVANLLTLMLLVMVFVLFYRKKKLLPTMIIVLYIWNILSSFADYYLGGLIPAVQDADGPGTLRQLVRSSLFGVIWIMYFIRSKRVKATFVN
ncbi:MAG: DUF2569 domain-containing protein [Paenibacillus dendritiformis]|uniref:DUF2569 domain-containing protein n=1 Tax=Paenibacillus dendritiformis TaxID=130049 RepID=UPI00143D2690|nr:DUF2569 domain-containing protein [Paenibacillus dendritiformis]MDU5144147.1 DUF2569 domain-containing protein [Paenibacillus dendritiformis]NKI20601.1 DUF2569 domain-containing protein [Paenibacillus dendritiformis]NRF96486.1 DUF2569 domain-containing protein [Paenibacillus dendritiformis]GIO70544.1 hypothetical protein J27TS7_00580 [Paenibacillus dendritiformis]